MKNVEKHQVENNSGLESNDPELNTVRILREFILFSYAYSYLAEDVLCINKCVSHLHT